MSDTPGLKAGAWRIKVYHLDSYETKLLTRQFVIELPDRGRSQDIENATLVFFPSGSQCRRVVYNL